LCLSIPLPTLIVPTKHIKGLRLHLTENWAPNLFRKTAFLQRLMSHSLGQAKILQRTKTKTPSQYRGLEKLTVYDMIKINNLICSMIYILKLRPQNLLVWNNALPHIKKLPHNRGLFPTLSLSLSLSLYIYIYIYVCVCVCVCVRVRQSHQEYAVMVLR
jgi:hypothetical protein